MNTWRCVQRSRVPCAGSLVSGLASAASGSADTWTRPGTSTGSDIPNRISGPLARALSSLATCFTRASILKADYREHAPGRHTLVYCDPPYAGTLGYGGTSRFDSAEFWGVARRWAGLGATVVVSESQAPVGWRVLAERERKAMLRVAVNEENETRREALWIVDN